jgi:hypothetical protein
MNIPDDLAERSDALAKDIPRPVISMLLKQLMAKVPARTREPDASFRTVPPRYSGEGATQPPSFARTRTRSTRRSMMSMMLQTITVTDKGRKRLAKLDSEDILHTICGAKTVREATRDYRVTAGDVNYAAKVGYIILGDI